MEAILHPSYGQKPNCLHGCMILVVLLLFIIIIIIIIIKKQDALAAAGIESGTFVPRAFF